MMVNDANYVLFKIIVPLPTVPRRFYAAGVFEICLQQLEPEPLLWWVSPPSG